MSKGKERKYIKAEDPENANVKWLAFGESKLDNAKILQEGESIEAVVSDIKEASKFSRDKKKVYVYRLRELDSAVEDPTLLVMPTTDLQKKLDWLEVDVGDQIQIEYTGTVKTKKGNVMKTFDVYKMSEE